MNWKEVLKGSCGTEKLDEDEPFEKSPKLPPKGHMGRKREGRFKSKHYANFNRGPRSKNLSTRADDRHTRTPVPREGEKTINIRRLDEDTKKSSKPDYIDLDKDGNTKEPMKEAAKDAKKKPKPKNPFTRKD